jgi:Protein of unknown function (DUF664)
LWAHNVAVRSIDKEVIHMPGDTPPAKGERANLLAFLEQQRNCIRLTAFGLTEEQLRATPTSSSLSIGGLIKHATGAERSWMDDVRQLPRPPFDPAKYGDDFTMGPDETLQDLLDASEQVGRETEATIAGIADLGQAVPVPKDVPFFPKDLDAWEVRWVLLHLIEEIARHAGHADIIREHLDGGTMYSIIAAAENWPEAPWIVKWKPSGDQVMPVPRH